MIRRACVLFGLAVPLYCASPAPAETAKDASAKTARQIPPVLRPTEEADTRIILLPGRPETRLASPPAKMAVPAMAAPLEPRPVTKPQQSAAEPPKVQRPPKAVPVTAAKAVKPPSAKPLKAVATKPSPTRRTQAASVDKVVEKKAALPAEFQKECVDYLRQRIGSLTEADARKLMGKALRERASTGEKPEDAGRILAFADPTHRYRSLELDFRAKTGKLRAVFAYPGELSWQKCRRLLGGDPIEAPAKGGRKFYSFSKKRVDVLVSANGNVVSLGMY